MENITQALAVTVFGMIIVFAVLIILLFILNLMKFFAPSEKAEAAKENVQEIKAAAPKAVLEDEDEIAAVLAAAVAASMNTAVSNFKIRSYKRLS